MDLNQIVNNKLTSRWTKFWLLLIFIFVAPFGIFVVLAWWLKRTDKVKSNQKKYFWKVKAKKGDKEYNWSDLWTFKILSNTNVEFKDDYSNNIIQNTQSYENNGND